jgi:hypothetical protein
MAGPDAVIPAFGARQDGKGLFALDELDRSQVTRHGVCESEGISSSRLFEYNRTFITGIDITADAARPMLEGRDYTGPFVAFALPTHLPHSLQDERAVLIHARGPPLQGGG